MSKRQEVTAVRVSNIPEPVFDASLDSDGPPTVTKLAEMGTKKAPVEQAPVGFVSATHAIGELRRFADWCQRHDPVMVAGGIYGYEVAHVRQHVAVVDTWMDTFIVHLKGESQ